MTNKDWLFLNSRDDLLRIDMKEIAYFEADGNYTNIVLTNKLKCTVGMSLGKMEQLLKHQERSRKEAQLSEREDSPRVVSQEGDRQRRAARWGEAATGWLGNVPTSGVRKLPWPWKS